jgi:hypothetical protein
MMEGRTGRRRQGERRKGKKGGREGRRLIYSQ